MSCRPYDWHLLYPRRVCACLIAPVIDLLGLGGVEGVVGLVGLLGTLSLMGILGSVGLLESERLVGLEGL